MGNDFPLKYCQSRKIVCLIIPVFLAPVLISQFFNLQYTFMPYTRAFFNNFSDHINKIDTVYNWKNMSYFGNNPLPSQPRRPPRPKIEELNVPREETEIRGVRVEPEESAHENSVADRNISDSPSYKAEMDRNAERSRSSISASRDQITVAPLESSGANARTAASLTSSDAVSSAPPVSRSQSVSPTIHETKGANNSQISNGGHDPSLPTASDPPPPPVASAVPNPPSPPTASDPPPLPVASAVLNPPSTPTASDPPPQPVASVVPNAPSTPTASDPPPLPVASAVRNAPSTTTPSNPPPPVASAVPNTPSPPAASDPPPPRATSAVPIPKMKRMLARSRVSSFSESPLWPSAADQELLDARFQIENGGAIIRKHPGLDASIFRNLTRFVRSYETMEKKLKVYFYKDGEKPIFHQPRLIGIYASEGWFMKHLEESEKFVTHNPREAHLFYLPFSALRLKRYVYIPNTFVYDDIIAYLKDYLDTIKTNYPFWNRTDGADHFFVACHDWAPFETKPLMAKSIRALCNANVREEFELGKDVSLAETRVDSMQDPLPEIGGEPPSKRKVLSFFAGRMHGYVRPILLHYWLNKDPDMRVFGKLMGSGYEWYMKSSKYCICAKGHEVNSPRVVEAIVYGCVPVIISDNFVPPFFEILKWESFAVFVLEKDIPNLKKILMSISEKRYVLMQHRVEMVRQHFLWHSKPVKYDIFHMILHSVWFNRVFRLKPGS